MRRVVEFLIMCAASALASGALAAEAPSTADVLAKIHAANQREIDMGRMAILTGGSNDVRKLGKTVVKDHLALEKKVAKVAKDEHVTLADAAPASGVEGLPQGDSFDASFEEKMLSSHRDAITELEQARATTTDEKLKKLIDEILPVLQKHEEATRRLIDETRRS